MSAPGKDRALLPLLLAVFAVGLLSVAGSLVFEHPDEKHYTDGAIDMREAREWITPRWPDGSLRLEKPILSFWLLLWSYEAWGVGLLASRAASLAAGALTIAVTYGIGLTVARRRSTALLAACICFSEPHVILAATWALPDALLTLWIALSAWGALELLLADRPRWWAPWAFYGAAGLAVATKGLLGLVFAAFVWILARWYPAPGGTASRLRHAPALLAGLAMAAWWYLAIAWQHGTEGLAIFLKDQTVADSPARWWEPLAHVPIYALLAWASLLPWSAALLALGRGGLPGRAAGADAAWFSRFALSWTGLLVLIFSASTWVDGRYLLPAGPILAVWLAAALDPAAEPRAGRALDLAFAVCAAGLAAVAAAFALLRLAIGQMAGAAALLGAVAAVLLAAVVARRRLSAPVGVALLVFAAFPLGAAGLAPLVKPDAGLRTMAAEIAGAPDRLPRSILVVGPQIMASNLRVATGGRFAVSRVPSRGWAGPGGPSERWPTAIVLPAGLASRADLSGYRTRAVPFGLDDISPAALVRAMLAGEAGAYLERHRDLYVVAVRD